MNFRRLSFYLAGQVGLMMMVRFLLQWIIRFSTTESPMHHDGTIATLFSASTMGAVLLGFRIFDGITDPISGSISDKWVRRGRERRHLLWYSFWLPAIGLVLCFAPSHDMPMALRWSLVVLGLGVFFVGYTLYCIPYWSLLSDYSNGDDSTQRTLSNLLGVGLLTATAIGFVVTPIMIAQFDYLTAALMIATIGTVLMVLPIYANPEQIGLNEQDSEDLPEPTMMNSLFVATRDREFVALLLLLAGAHMSLTIMTSAAPFIAIHLLGGTDKDVALLLGPFLGVGLLCLTWTAKLSQKLGWRKSLVFACVGLGVVYASTSRLDVPLFGTPMTAATCIFMCGGPMVAVILGIEGEAITACAIRQSKAHVSIYWGVYNFVVKAMNGVAIWVCGLLAARISLGENSILSGDSAVRAMSITAGSFLVLGVFAYALSRPRKDRVFFRTNDL